METLIKYPKFKQVEKNYIKDLIKFCEGNVIKAASISGMGRATIYRKLKDYGISSKWYL